MKYVNSGWGTRGKITCKIYIIILKILDCSDLVLVEKYTKARLFYLTYEIYENKIHI